MTRGLLDYHTLVKIEDDCKELDSPEPKRACNDLDSVKEKLYSLFNISGGTHITINIGNFKHSSLL